jgi:hypothetical protein
VPGPSATLKCMRIVLLSDVVCCQLECAILSPEFSRRLP